MTNVRRYGDFMKSVMIFWYDSEKIGNIGYVVYCQLLRRKQFINTKATDDNVIVIEASL